MDKAALVSLVEGDMVRLEDIDGDDFWRRENRALVADFFSLGDSTGESKSDSREDEGDNPVIVWTAATLVFPN